MVVCVLDLSTRTDENVVAFYLHVVATHTIAAAIHPLSVANIECQIVPRAGDHKSFEAAFAQRSPFVGTQIVNRKVFPIDVEEGDLPLVQGDDL